MLRIIELSSLRSRSAFSFAAKRVGRQLLVAMAMLSLAAFAPMAVAVPINYGNFSGTTVDYIDVEEDTNSGDTLPLFGAPSVSGDSLDFDPVGFNAHSTGAAGVDVTDGNLNFMIMAKAGYAIDMLSLSEAGDTTLSGFGTNATFTSVTGIGNLDILEVDGVGITPKISVPINLVFTPSGGTYELGADGGGGPLFSTIWSGSWLKNIEQELINNNVPYTLGATKVSINLDNTLTALSEAGTFALIAKKDFGGVSITVNIPEPATWLLVSVCGVLAAAGGRRR